MSAASDFPRVASFALYSLYQGNTKCRRRRVPASLETSSPSLVYREGPAAYRLGAEGG